MKFGRNIQKTPEQSLHVSVFMWVCFFISFCLSNRTPKITPILTLYQANMATLMPFSIEGTILIKKSV